MYIHSVKLINYKSIGDYDESEIILEPSVTTIIGKNESGKSNVLDGLSQIDLIGNKASSYAPEKINRAAPVGSEIQYLIVLKPTQSDIENGLNEETKITLSKSKYEMTGGLFTYYCEKVKGYTDSFVTIIDSLGANPFKLRDQELTNYKSHVKILKDDKNLDVARFLNALTYFRQKTNTIPTEQKTEYAETLTNIETAMRSYCMFFPHFFYRNSDKHLQTTYKLEDVEKELNTPSVNAKSLLFNFVSLLGITTDEFILAVKSGAAPQQVTCRKKINSLINEKINKPFQDFYTTEKISLELDFNSNLVSFSVQSENGAALMLSERSNGLKWYLETFIDAKSHNVSTTNAIYLLDEPGTSLHVNAQKELITLFHHLATQGNQVVYTTHSPYMLETESDGIIRIRAVMKDKNGYSRIYKTAYDARIAPDSQADTLAPLINAIGMNLSDTFGPAKDKLNIVTEGMSDYIYMCLLAKLLNVDTERYAIIPSVGASNCVNICSILHGWGCKYLAVFDYDKAGVESGGEIMNQKMRLTLGEHYCYLADVTQNEIDAKTYKTDAGKCMIENLITYEELDKFCTDLGIPKDYNKSLIAKMLSNAVSDNKYKLGAICIENFKKLFKRIL